ncbi:MAG TPA: caspase family protein, partial [Acetobacteraceae bacterium]
DIRARLARQPLARVLSLCVPREQDCAPLPLTRGTAALPPGAELLRLTASASDRGLGLGPLDVFVNGRNAGRHAPPASDAAVTMDIPLDPGPNSIELRLYDAGGAIFTGTAPLALARDSPAAAPGQGRLFVLAIGVNRFGNPALALRFAAADARAFAERVRAAAAPLYSEVVPTVLLDGDATRTNILATFDRLSREIRPTDTFLFYVASHGVLDEATDRFLLVPSDLADTSSWRAMANQAIDETTLVSALSRIEARDALLFLDTCHSGKVTADTLSNMGHETGRYLLTASTSVQEALDSYDNRNGVFLYAVAEALSGRAGQDSDGNLGALSLGEYVSRRVGQLARQKGHDQDALFRAAQQDLRSFPVARMGK